MLLGGIDVVFDVGLDVVDVAVDVVEGVFALVFVVGLLSLWLIVVIVFVCKQTTRLFCFWVISSTWFYQPIINQ